MSAFLYHVDAYASPGVYSKQSPGQGSLLFKGTLLGICTSDHFSGTGIDDDESFRFDFFFEPSVRFRAIAFDHLSAITSIRGVRRCQAAYPLTRISPLDTSTVPAAQTCIGFSHEYSGWLVALGFAKMRTRRQSGRAKSHAHPDDWSGLPCLPTGKHGGCIVDYANVFASLYEASAIYGGDTQKFTSGYPEQCFK
jgi:hypothetical protein